MRRALLVAALFPTVSFPQSPIVDATGREIRPPPKVERVYAAGPPAGLPVFAIAPDKLTGWTRAMRPNEAQFFDDKYARLPELGRLTGRGNTANVEGILKARTDLIVDVGSTGATLASLAAQAGNLVYPREFGVDLRAKVSEFHRLLYHREPTSAQLDALLGEPGVLPK